MNDIVASLFVTPIPITGIGRLIMLIPLCMSISIVYKTMRCERLSQVALASVILCFTILVVMGLIGVILLLVFRMLA
jgi:hypothetical protein